MKIGIYGGTFNPPHIGHLILAEKATEILKLDKLIFVPAFIPPHKKLEKIISAEHRLKMLRLSVINKDYFDVSDIEIKRGGMSYTYDTINYFKNIFKNSKLFLLVGYDNFLGFHLWNNYEKIFELCTVIVLKRNCINPEKHLLNKYRNNKIKFIDTPLMDISSTEIRRRISEEKGIEYYVTSKVAKYIEKHKIYK
jgi:nicotinate-nucleotide adenylyltransferase